MSCTKYINPLCNEVYDQLDLIKKDIISALKLEEDLFYNVSEYHDVIFFPLDKDCIFFSHERKHSLLIRKGLGTCYNDTSYEKCNCSFYCLPLFTKDDYHFNHHYFPFFSNRSFFIEEIFSEVEKVCSCTYHNGYILSLKKQYLFPFVNSLGKIHSDLPSLRKKFLLAFEERFCLIKNANFNDFFLEESLKLLNYKKNAQQSVQIKI